MLRRVADPDHPPHYRSPLLDRAGVRHAFTTRIGGVSSGPFESLNLGNPAGDVQDSAENLRMNDDRVQQAIGCAQSHRRWMKQVHGHRVAVVDSQFVDGCDGDGLLTSDPDDLLTVRVADCVPILLTTDDGRHVAAVHAGWRGVVGEIVPAAVHRLAEIARCPTTRLLAAIGPCIGPTAFEVGSEVWSIFESAISPACVRRPDVSGKAFVDLRLALQIQLNRVGLTDDAIDISDQCTLTNRAEFFSHRRDAGLTGRMAAFIAPR